MEDANLMWSPKPNYCGKDLNLYSKGFTDHKHKAKKEKNFLSILYSGADFNVNSQGLRDKEYKVKKDKNIFRILCLGDSSTMGFGVKIEETYHSLLENRLNNDFRHDGIRYEVINGGVMGYSSCQGLGFYKLKGYKYMPDIVTFYFGINDRNQRFCLSDKQIMRRDVPTAVKAAMENNLLLKLHSYRLLRNFIFNYFDIGKNNSIWKDVPRVSVEEFKENILELNSLCKKNGALLLLISFPYSKNKYTRGEVQGFNVQTLAYRRELENISKEYKIPLVTIPEMSEESPVDTTIFFLDVIHPNQLGHQRIMLRLYDYLMNNKLLPQKYADFR
jgi:lysophospholipase L1-like esterase